MNYQQLDQFQKYLITFASLFHDIYIPQYSEENVLLSYIKVPIIYGMQDKYYDIANSNTILNISNDNEGFECNYPLPSMSVVFSSLSMNTTLKRSELIEVNEKGVLTPLPMVSNITLTLEAKNQTDIFKILEQIYPIFPNEIAKEVNVTIDGDNSIYDELRFSLESANISFPIDFVRTQIETYIIDLTFKMKYKLFKVPRVLPASADYNYTVIVRNEDKQIDDIIYPT